MGHPASNAVTRRAFLLAAPSALVALPACGALATEPPKPAKGAVSPGPAVKQSTPRRITEPPAHLWPYVDPRVRFSWVDLPEAQNAWPVLCKATRLVTAGEPQPSVKEEKKLREWLEKKRPVLGLLDQAIARGRCQYPKVYLLNGLDQPQVEDAVDIWALTRVRLHLAVTSLPAGKLTAEVSDAAARQITQALRLAQVVAEGDGMYREAGQEVQESTLWLLQSVSRMDMFAADSLQTLIRDLPGFFLSPQSYQRIVRLTYCYVMLPLLDRLSENSLDELVDQLMAFHFLVRRYVVIEHAEDHVRRYRDDLRKLLAGHPRPYDKQETVRITSRQAAELLVDLDRPYLKRRRDLGSENESIVAAWPPQLNFVSPDIGEFLGDMELEKARAALLSVKNPVGKLAATTVEELAIRPKIEHLRLQFAATRVLLALRLFKNKYGWLPQTLDALEQEKLIDAVPLDPFSGKPLSYSRDRGVLWSRGVDEKDDGGLEDPHEDCVEGKDIVWKIPPGES